MALPERPLPETVSTVPGPPLRVHGHDAQAARVVEEHAAGLLGRAVVDDDALRRRGRTEQGRAHRGLGHGGAQPRVGQQAGVGRLEGLLERLVRRGQAVASCEQLPSQVAGRSARLGVPAQELAHRVLLLGGQPHAADEVEEQRLGGAGGGELGGRAVRDAEEQQLAAGQLHAQLGLRAREDQRRERAVGLHRVRAERGDDLEAGQVDRVPCRQGDRAVDLPAAGRELLAARSSAGSQGCGEQGHEDDRTR